jgi:hypothetical protein
LKKYGTPTTNSMFYRYPQNPKFDDPTLKK